MNISICITTFNEEGSIGSLLDSLLVQNKKANEIVIVDGGSTDNTIKIINHYQKRFGGIKLLKERCNRAEGRNLGIEIAKNEIIAITDAGCVAHKDWLKKLSQPFENKIVDISAGFYKMVPTILPNSAYVMTGAPPVNRAMGIFLGVTPGKFGINFLPSTRSMAFRKSAWEAVGGFPEGRENSAEDTDFNYKAVKLGLKYARVKTAIVEWGMPTSIYNFQFKIFKYAQWDAKYGIWWHPSQRIASHNIKALSIFIRYIIGLLFIILSVKYTFFTPLLLICMFGYIFWSFRKVYIEFGEIKVAFWGPILQIVSDFAVMSGFVSGILGRQ